MDGELYERFEQLLASGRGDNARGRNLQTLLLLNLSWSLSHLPIANYRPRKNPAAFLALIVDVADSVKKQELSSQAARDGKLDQSLKDFLADISSDFPTLSEELGKILTNVLLDEGRSTLSQHLRRLKMYMTEAEFSRIKPVRVIEELSMAEIFAYLGYLPPELGAGVERHPMGRDLRKALRTNLDGLWSDQLACLGPSDIQLAACFPLNFMKLAEKLPVPLADFSFFYGLITNAKSPGRIWQPPLAFMGTKEAYAPYANLLEDSDFKTSRLGLSGTMPQTIKVFDTWLESKSLQDQLSKTTWRAYFQQKHELVNRHRISFLAALEKGRSWQA